MIEPDMRPRTASPHRFVGLIPAAGRATRLAPLPCSKELLPIGLQRDPADGLVRPKPVSMFLIEQMRRAGADRLCIVLRSGKWDIADYFGDGSRLGLPIAYFLTGVPWGPAFTAAQALPFIAEDHVLFGFPDILLDPPDILAQAAERLLHTDADIVLGLCPMRGAGAPSDVVGRDAAGRVLRLEPKEQAPIRHADDWTWTVAAWKPSFSTFLQQELARLARIARDGPQTPAPEWPFGVVIAAAIRAGMHVDSVGESHWRMLDTGTPAGLIAAPGFPGVWSGDEDATPANG